jgi:hypothetical protein
VYPFEVGCEPFPPPRRRRERTAMYACMSSRTSASVRDSSPRRAYSTRVGPGVERGEVGRTLGLVVDLTKAAGELRGRTERRHAVALDQPADRGVIHAGLERQLALAHLLLLQLAAQPGIEGSRRLKCHA